MTSLDLGLELLGPVASRPVLLALPFTLFGVGAILWPATTLHKARLGELAAAGRLLPARQEGLRWRRIGSSVQRLLASPGGRLVVPISVGGVALCVQLHLLSLAAVAFAVVGQRGLLRRLDDRRRRRDRIAASQAVSLLCAELAAGARPEVALTAAATVARSAPQVSDALDAAADASRAGDEPAAQLIGSGFPPHPTVLNLATAWRLSAQTGIALVTVLERLGEDLQARQTSTDAVAAAVAGARSSATLLALLPVVGCALGAAMGAKPWFTLTQTAAGQVLGPIGALLDMAGLVWTAHLVRRAERA